jgi:hypothetical protein
MTVQYLLLGAVPFPSDVVRLKDLGVQAVVTLNESYETLVPTAVYQVHLPLCSSLCVCQLLSSLPFADENGRFSFYIFILVYAEIGVYSGYVDDHFVNLHTF